MKSLEIVDRKLSEAYSGGQFATDNAYIEDDELFIIRKDLEVLEIIRKKQVDIGYVSDLVNRYSDDDYILERYNEIVSTLYKLTKDELNKLKQWLEVNEDAI